MPDPCFGQCIDLERHVFWGAWPPIAGQSTDSANTNLVFLSLHDVKFGYQYSQIRDQMSIEQPNE